MDLNDFSKIFPRSATTDNNGNLVLGGVGVNDLIENFGTPLYVICEETLLKQCNDFVDAFQKRHKDTLIAYASKAYLGPALAQIISHQGLGLDIVSGGELGVTKLVEFPPEKIYFHGNNKIYDELYDAVNYGVGRVVLDSETEFQFLEKIASELNVVQDVMIRVNPSVDPHTHSHTTTGILDSKFGVPIETGQATDLLRKVLASKSLNLMGLHFHLGSPIFETQPYAEAIKIVIAFASEFKSEGFILKEFSPGGGFAIPYTRSQSAPSPDDYAEVIVNSLISSCDENQIPLPRLVVEPGRSIIGSSGVAIYTVGTIKEVIGIRSFAAVDGGMGDNIRPALYEAEYEAIVANRIGEQAKKKYSIVGKFCESGDILVKEAQLPILNSGDLIAIPVSGAYNASMASNYNMNARPPIVSVRDGKFRLWRRRETLSDMISGDIW